jgi:hypothetical protein
MTGTRTQSPKKDIEAIGGETHMAIEFSSKNKTLVGTATVADDIHTVEIAITDYSEADLNLMSTYGEPVVDFGGEIKSATNVVLATLPTNLRKIRSQVPYIQEFPSRQYAAVATVTAAYETVMVNRIKAALDDLRTTTDEDLGGNTVTY